MGVSLAIIELLIFIIGLKDESGKNSQIKRSIYEKELFTQKI